MKYNEVDKTKKYANGRLYFINHKGKEIEVGDYKGLSGQAYIAVIDENTKFHNSLEIEGKEILNFLDFTDTKGSIDVIEKLKEAAYSFTRNHVRKTACIGLTSLQKIFVQTFTSLGITDLKPFNTKEEALDWLVED